MALQGTLEEFGAIELLQLPYNGKRTCQLILTGEQGEASVYYDNGQLVHAQFQNHVGEEVIEEIMEWSKGTFELLYNINSPDKTINKDLHNLLLLMVKKRDEKASAAQANNKQKQHASNDFKAELEKFHASNAFAVNLSIIDKAGNVIAQVNHPEKIQEQIADIQKLAAEITSVYPRKGLKRTFYEDELGIIGAINLANSWTLLVIAEPDHPLGAFWLALGKLANNINAKLMSNEKGNAQSHHYMD